MYVCVCVCVCVNAYMYVQKQIHTEVLPRQVDAALEMLHPICELLIVEPCR